MSSQVIGEVFQVYKRCKAKGGMLKICQVSPQVAGVFAHDEHAAAYRDFSRRNDWH